MPPRRPNPYLDFRFQVDIDYMRVAGFSEVAGLTAEVETEEYEEGGVNDYTHTLPKRISSPNLELKRGLTDSQELWGWYEAVAAGRIQRRNVRILLLDETGEQTWGWECKDAYPVRWAGPEFRAGEGSVAVETLELAHNGLSQMEGMPTG